MQSSYRIFKIFGISVELHITFLLFFLILFVASWVEGGISFGIGTLIPWVLVFTMVLLHELSHSIVAILNKIDVSRIILLPIGGLASVEIPEKPEIELMVSIAGPMFNFVFAILCIILFLLTIPDPFTVFSTMEKSLGSGDIASIVFNPLGIIFLLVYINMFLGLFNILPGFPMDGGRIFRSILAFFMDYIKATRIAVNTGRAMFIIMILLGIFAFDPPHILLIIIGIFLLYVSGNELQMVQLKHNLRNLTLGQIAIRNMNYVNESISIRNFLDSVARPQQTYYPVTDANGKVSGVLDIRELSNLTDIKFDITPVKNITRKEFATADANIRIDDALTNLLTKDFTLIIAEKTVIGYITPEYLLEIARFHGITKRK